MFLLQLTFYDPLLFFTSLQHEIDGFINSFPFGDSVSSVKYVLQLFYKRPGVYEMYSALLPVRQSVVGLS